MSGALNKQQCSELDSETWIQAMSLMWYLLPQLRMLTDLAADWHQNWLSLRYQGKTLPVLTLNCKGFLNIPLQKLP